MKEHPVIIIGAGTAGLYLSGLLEKAGIDFITLDKRSTLGTYGPRIINLETLEKLNLPAEILIKPIKKIDFYSPKGVKISKSGEEPRGYVVNLKSIEQHLLDSIKNKQNIRLGQNVVDFDLKKKTIKLIDETELGFKVLIFATGVLGVKFRDKLGISHPKNVFCYAVEVRANDEITTVIDNKNAPGFYGWIIPLHKDRIEVGFGAEELNIRDHGDIQKKLFSLAHLKQYKHHKILKENGGFIPTGMINKKANNEWIVIGDAAGGEPMLGGSIHKCVDEALIACETIKEYLAGTTQTLEGYEKKWERLEGDDLKSQTTIRNILDSSKNEEFDKVFEKLKDKELTGKGLINDLFRNIILNLKSEES